MPKRKYTMTQSGDDRVKYLRKWNEEHKEQSTANALRAQSMRTTDTFKQQSATMTETWARKRKKFAELVEREIAEGKELEMKDFERLQKLASDMVKEELKKERRKAKAQKPSV